MRARQVREPRRLTGLQAFCESNNFVQRRSRSSSAWRNLLAFTEGASRIFGIRWVELQLEGSLQYLVCAAAVPGFQQDHSQVILELAVAGSARCGIAGQRKCGRVQALAVIYPAQCVRDVGIIGLSATATDVPAVALVPATTLPIRRGFAGGAGREGIDKPKVGRLQQLFVSPTASECHSA